MYHLRSIWSYQTNKTRKSARKPHFMVASSVGGRETTENESNRNAFYLLSGRARHLNVDFAFGLLQHRRERVEVVDLVRCRNVVDDRENAERVGRGSGRRAADRCARRAERSCAQWQTLVLLDLDKTRAIRGDNQMRANRVCGSHHELDRIVQSTRAVCARLAADCGATNAWVAHYAQFNMFSWRVKSRHERKRE